MLTILMAMSVAVEPPRVVTLPGRARPAATVLRKRPVMRRAQVTRRTAPCVSGSCKVDVSARYRLMPESGAGFSGKMHAVRATGMPCGVQGAPVCPRGGQTVVRAAID